MRYKIHFTVPEATLVILSAKLHLQIKLTFLLFHVLCNLSPSLPAPRPPLCSWNKAFGRGAAGRWILESSALHFLKLRRLVLSPGRAHPARYPEVCPAMRGGRRTVVSCSSEEGGRVVQVPRSWGPGSRGAPSLWGRGVLPGRRGRRSSGWSRGNLPRSPAPPCPHLSLICPSMPPPSPLRPPSMLPPPSPAPSLHPSPVSSVLHPPCFLGGAAPASPARTGLLSPARARAARSWGIWESQPLSDFKSERRRSPGHLTNRSLSPRPSNQSGGARISHRITNSASCIMHAAVCAGETQGAGWARGGQSRS